MAPFPAMDLGDFQLNGQLINNNNSTVLSEIIESTNMCGLSSSRALKEEESDNNIAMRNSMYYNKETSNSHMSATELLQKATTMGCTRSNSAVGMFANGLVFINNNDICSMDELLVPENRMMMMTESKKNESEVHGKLLQGNMTRDFLGVGRNVNKSKESDNSRVLLQHEVDKFCSDIDRRE